MNRSRVVLLAAAAATIGSAGCFDDPTSDLAEGPVALRLSASRAVLPKGDTLVVTAFLVDARGAQLPGLVSFSSKDASVATAADLPGDTLPRQLRSSGRIVAVGAGRTNVVVTGGGVTDSIIVTVFPTAFDGTISPATANVGDTITITGTSVISVGPSATVTINGLPTFLVSSTASQIKLVAGPVASGGVVEISDLILLGTIALPTLAATTSVTITESGEPANNAPATGPAVALPAAVGSSVDKYGSLDGDVDDYFTITTTTADSVQIRWDWNTDADVDGFLLNSAGGGFCVLDGCAAATGANPETIKVRLAAATTYKLYANLFAAGSSVPLVYRMRITKLN